MSSHLWETLGGKWLSCFALVWFVATDAFACEQVRAALDIGSGTTKMVVARVDYCQNRIVDILAPAPGAKLERKVEWQRNTIEDPNGGKVPVFAEDVIAGGLSAILELKAVALSHGAEAFSAVATAAFRSVRSANPIYAEAVIELIRRQTGVRVAVLSQEGEARIGFHSAAMKLGMPLQDLVVWDIGGGSMQISEWNGGTNTVSGYRGEFANDAMQRFIIEVLQRKVPLTTSSPNPIGPVGVSQAIREAESVARRGLQSTFLRMPPKSVIGIGGVHFSSNCELLQRYSADGCEFTREELLNQARRFANLTDRELVENRLSATLGFAPFRVSGAALTVGFMNALGIDRVRAIEVNMAGGILLESDFWSQR
jgi:exopolyphosphatase/guanosine-5'-triphosphate,3'-diphosphate pyrophosphatase